MSHTDARNIEQESPIEIDSNIGRCLRCGARLTLCGVPFTLTVRCDKCLYINIYEDSRQPVRGRGQVNAIIR